MGLTLLKDNRTLPLLQPGTKYWSAAWNMIFSLVFTNCFLHDCNYTVTGFYFRPWHHSSADILALFFYSQNCNGELKDIFLLSPHKNFLRIFLIISNILYARKYCSSLRPGNGKHKQWELYVVFDFCRHLMCSTHTGKL